MKWPQRNSQAAPRQRRLSQFGRTLVESMDHDRNHWFIRHRLCPHPTQRPPISSPRYGLSDHNHRSLSHPSTTDRQIDRQVAVRRPSTQETFASCSKRNLPTSFLSHTTSQLPARHTSSTQEAHGPHLPVAEEIPLLPHKGSSTDQKAPNFVSTSSRIPLVSIPFKEST